MNKLSIAMLRSSVSEDIDIVSYVNSFLREMTASLFGGSIANENGKKLFGGMMFHFGKCSPVEKIPPIA